MSLLSGLKSLLPASSRSFHRDMDNMSLNVEQVRNDLQSVQQELISLRSSISFMESYVAHDKAYYLLAEPGYPNYGDELIAKEWIKYLAEIHPDKNVYLDCDRPGPAAAILDGLHPHLTVVDTVARLSHENEAAQQQKSAGEIAQTVYEAINDESKAARYASGIRLIHNRVHGFHVLGGGWLNSQWRDNLARLAVIQWANTHDLPTVATGIGLQPLDDDDIEYVNDVFACFNAASCRNSASRDFIAERCPNVKVGVDDCFVNGLDGVYSSRSDLPKIMVCVQSDFVSDKNEMLAHVLRILQEWQIPQEERIGVTECMPYADNPIFFYLRDHGYNVELFSTQNILDGGFPACEGQRWISTRYHPHLLAAARGCSGVYISPDSAYYDAKHQAVVDMGSHWSKSVIGQPIPQLGMGFDDPQEMIADYRKRVRESASVLYGL